MVFAFFQHTIRNLLKAGPLKLFSQNNDVINFILSITLWLIISLQNSIFLNLKSKANLVALNSSLMIIDSITPESLTITGSQEVRL